MKLSNDRIGRVLAGLASVLVTAILFAGCAVDDAPSLSGSPVKGGRGGQALESARFQPGDKIVVILTGTSDVIPPHMENVKDDGTITMPSIGSVVALGRSPGDLQKDIFNLYVPRFYNSNLNVTVSSEERFVFVGGEVRSPSRILYTGDFTVVKAIQSAGDFTVFANQKKVTISRPDGTVIHVNCEKAIKDPSLDVPVFPGDKIYVKRRLF